MRRNRLLGVLLFVFICSMLNAQKNNENEVELSLFKKEDPFIWQKGSDLDLKCKITNRSKQEIILIMPKKSKEFKPSLFEIVLPEEFRGTLCDFSVGNDEYAKPDDFCTIKPGEEKEFSIYGRNYFLNYCNKDATLDSISIYIRYKGEKNKFDKDSYFIQNYYNSQLTEIEEKDIKEQVESMINRNYSNLIEQEKDKKRQMLWNALSKDKIKCTPQEQELIIKLYNASFTKQIKSNSISIRIEK
jgi:hypothetical protein